MCASLISQAHIARAVAMVFDSRNLNMNDNSEVLLLASSHLLF